MNVRGRVSMEVIVMRENRLECWRRVKGFGEGDEKGRSSGIVVVWSMWFS